MERIRPGKMSERAMVQRVQEATGLPKQDAKNAVSAVFEIMNKEIIEGRQVGITGLGTLKTIWLKPRESYVDFGSEGEKKKKGWRRKVTFSAGRGMSNVLRHEHFNDDPNYDPRTLAYEELPPKAGDDEDAGQ